MRVAPITRDAGVTGTCFGQPSASLLWTLYHIRYVHMMACRGCPFGDDNKHAPQLPRLQHVKVPRQLDCEAERLSFAGRSFTTAPLQSI
mmetsp:Transcript_3085/g.9419  ORF Transcript_3085/g.9419 Transcript_3085/m.9419 type:complete len:89 (-) Transcript_3085:447-713(-)